MPESDVVKGSVVVTADQIGSRKGGDNVPAALDALAQLRLGRSSRRFARTAGDEIQGLVTDSAAVVSVIETLTRLGGWRIGIGIGDVDRPVPRDVRAANGPAFLAARDALNTARSAPQDLRVVGPPSCAEAEAVLWLLLSVWRRRTPAGWEACTVAADGRPQQQVAKSLGITASAVSQRLRSSGFAETQAGARLVERLLDRARAETVGGPG